MVSSAKGDKEPLCSIIHSLAERVILDGVDLGAEWLELAHDVNYSKRQRLVSAKARPSLDLQVIENI